MSVLHPVNYYYFVVKQKTAYEMRISDWSSDVCSSDLPSSGSTLLATQPVVPGLTFNPSDPASIANYIAANAATVGGFHNLIVAGAQGCNPVFEGDPFNQNNPACFNNQIGRASCRERVCQKVYISVVVVTIQQKTYTIINKIVVHDY